MRKTALFGLCVCGILILLTAPAQAVPLGPSETWSGLLTSDHCTGGCGTPPFGSVLLEQFGTTVDFTVTLFGSNEFVVTGAGDSMNFKFNGLGVALADIVVPAGLDKATGSFCGDSGGCFDFGVVFHDQGPGGSDPRPGPILFSVDNATIFDLTQLNNLNQIFVADIIGAAGATGLVDVSSGEGTPIPEPGTMLLLGIGLLGLAGIRRFKK